VAPAGAVVNVAGNQLTVKAAGLQVGTVFEILLTVGGGAETANGSFLVTVTA